MTVRVLPSSGQLLRAYFKVAEVGIGPDEQTDSTVKRTGRQGVEQQADLFLAELLGLKCLGMLQDYALLRGSSCLCSFPSLDCSFSCYLQYAFLQRCYARF